MLIMRKENMKGVNILSLEDGTILSSIENMHTKAIMDFCILDDMNTLISAGRDKKIKVWIVKN
jgi:WD40 repeat protein